MNKKPQLAWKLYLKMETSGESVNLLQLIANDCYKVSLSLIIKKKKKKVAQMMISYVPSNQGFSMILWFRVWCTAC